MCARWSAKWARRRRSANAPASESARLPMTAAMAAARRALAQRRNSRRSTNCSTARLVFRSFRPNQEAVCRAVIEGKDVLLVMPTGSGKSLCYQLPGMARGRDNTGDQPADRTDGRSGREAEGARLRGGAHPFGPRPRSFASGMRSII